MASNFKSYISDGIGEANTTIYTSGASTTVIGFSLANITDSAITASAFVTKSGGGGTAYIVKNAPIPYGGSMIVVGAEQKVVLEVGDTLNVSANTESSVDAIISTLEIT
jgi:hypothetical protein